MKMTSKERLEAVMRGGVADRIPVSPRIGAFLMGKYGSSSLESHIRFQKEYEYDISFTMGSSLPNPTESVLTELPYTDLVKIETEVGQDRDLKIVKRIFHTPAGRLQDVTMIPPAGREYGVSPNPVKTEWLIKDKSDLEKLVYLLPDPFKHTNTQGFLNAEKILGDKGIIQIVIRSPIDKRAGDARGMENLMVDYYEDPELFDAVLEFYMDHVMAETKACLEAGVKHIFGSWFYTSLSSGWSPKISREKFIPLMKRHVELVHSYGATYDLYDDGKFMQVIEDYADTGADVLETLTPPPVGDIDLAAAKKLVGDRIVLKGYVDLLYVLKLGTPEMIRETVREAVEKAGYDGRFILGTSDSIRDGTPEQNVKEYFEAAKRYVKL